MNKIPKCKSGAGGSESQFTPSWKYFSLCGFLKDILVPGEEVGNLDVSDETLVSIAESQMSSAGENESTYNDSDFEDDVRSISESSMGSSKPPLDDVHILRPFKKRKSSNLNIGSEMLAIEKQKLAIIEKEINKEKRSSINMEDPDVQFLTSLIPYIKELNHLERLEVRQEIQKVVLQAHKRSSQVIVVHMDGSGSSCTTTE